MGKELVRKAELDKVYIHLEHVEQLKQKLHCPEELTMFVRISDYSEITNWYGVEHKCVTQIHDYRTRGAIMEVSYIGGGKRGERVVL